MKRVLLTLFGLASVHADEAWKPVDPVPQRFPIERDPLGYSWQLTAAGSFYSSGGNVFESANQLTVNGERFQADQVEVRQGHHAFTGRCGTDWIVRREVWIDPDRSAACHLEEIRNGADRMLPMGVELSTRFRTPWRSWTALDGKARISSGLQASAGAFLTFAPREGESDLVLLLGDGMALQPSVKTDGQDFMVRFEFELAPGAALRLFHAMGQRRAPPGLPPEADPFAAWFSAGRLVLEGVSGDLGNFGLPAVAESGEAVWTLRDGGRRRVTEVGAGVVILQGALGTIRLAAGEIAGFDGRIWTTREGHHFAAVAIPGQIISVTASPEGSIAIPVEELAGIRVSGSAVGAPDGLRLKNGDLWPGKPVGASAGAADFRGWEIQGTVREVPRGWVDDDGK